MFGCAPKNAQASNGSGGAMTIEWDSEFDVVVVGFGDAGAAAAITAADEGANVLLLDKAPEHYEGGNSRYCEQLICVWDNEQDGYDFAKAMADGFADATDEVLRYIARGGCEVVPWLESLGGSVAPYGVGKRTDIPKDYIYKGYGKSGYDELMDTHWIVEHADDTVEFGEYAVWPNAEANNARYYWVQLGAPDNEEKKLWRFLRSHVANRADKISVWFNAPAVKLIQDPVSKAVLGVTIDHNGKKKNVSAKNGVVLSCGSYEGNPDAYETYAHRANHLPIGSIYNTGDGITLGTAVGAKLWHMNALSGPWLNPKIPDVDRCYWVGGMFQRFTTAGNCITVAKDGKRFMREMGMHKHGHVYLGGTWQNQQLPEAMWAIFDQTARTGDKRCSMIDPELIISANTIEELAGQIELDAATLVKTVGDYNHYCQQGQDDEFNRTPSSLAPIETAPYYAIRLYGGCVNAQGGPKRNTDCQVLDVDEKPIPHLYSAGELGSFWAGAYIGGGNIAECLFTGRTAGANAAAAKEDALAVEINGKPSPNELVVIDDPAADVSCEANEYAGFAEGIHAPIVVKVKVENGKMSRIDVISQKETGAVVHDLFEKMPAAMIAANLTEVDGVTGATCSSNAFRKAVQAALDKVK